VSPVARAGGMALSLLAHVAVGGALLTLSVTDWRPPLFVDLVERAESPGVPAAGMPGPSAPAARSHERSGRAGARAPRAAAAPERAAPPEAPGTAARPAPAAPPAPSAEPVPPPPAAHAAPPPAAAPVALPPPAPGLADSSPAPADPPSPPASPAPATSPSPAVPARGGAADGPPGVRAGGATRGDAPSSPGGAPGAPLALGSPGAGAGTIPAEYGPYLQRFRQRVQESLVYPLAARRQGLRGTVELDVWLDPAGRVRDVRVARSSSHDLLDEAAVETIRGLGPLPFPDSLPRRSLRIRLPLVFDLR
jgi:protein TonB